MNSLSNQSLFNQMNIIQTTVNPRRIVLQLWTTKETAYELLNAEVILIFLSEKPIVQWEMTKWEMARWKKETEQVQRFRAKAFWPMLRILKKAIEIRNYLRII